MGRCARRSRGCAPTRAIWRRSPAGASDSSSQTRWSTGSSTRIARPEARRSALVLAGGKLLVLVEIHQVLELGLVRHLDLDQPALVERILVDDAGVILELGVHCGHRPAQCRDQLLDGASGLHLSERLALLHLVADVG